MKSLVIINIQSMWKLCVFYWIIFIYIFINFFLTLENKNLNKVHKKKIINFIFLTHYHFLYLFILQQPSTCNTLYPLPFSFSFTLVLEMVQMRGLDRKFQEKYLRKEQKNARVRLICRIEHARGLRIEYFIVEVKCSIYIYTFDLYWKSLIYKSIDGCNENKCKGKKHIDK